MVDFLIKEVIICEGVNNRHKRLLFIFTGFFNKTQYKYQSSIKRHA